MTKFFYPMELKYRADIDGLRAIAVMAVILYHAEVPGFSGGFVGVDIFFVISGYLITSIILREIENDSFSISRFYERRIRRIFPALFFVVIVSLIISIFLLDPKTFEGFGESIVATILFFSNILFLGQSGYFAAPSLQKPMLHTWSLAVEEQFYIVFPLFLVFVKKYIKRSYLISISFALLLSFLINVLLVDRYPKETFFYMHSRAWELLFGSVVSLIHVRNVFMPGRKRWLSVIGFFMILYSVYFYDDSIVYPGYYALLPVAGAVTIIFSGLYGHFDFMEKILESKIVLFVGKISYSLYLWHWVVIVYYRYWVNRSLNPSDKIILVLIPFLLAYFSWKYVENPFRGKNMLIPDRKKIFAYSALVMFVLTSAGIAVFASHGWPERRNIGVDSATVTRVREDKTWKKRLRSGIIGYPESARVFILWGDSHAEALAPVLHQTAEKYGFSGYIRVDGGAPPVLGMERKKVGYDLSGKNNAVISFIASHPEVELVILSCNYNGYKDNPQYTVGGERINSVRLESAIIHTVRVLTGMHKKVVLVTQCPEIGHEPVKLLWISGLKNVDYHQELPCYEVWDKSVEWMGPMMQLLSVDNNVTIINMYEKMFDKHGYVRMIDGEQLLYSDATHLSVAGARYLAPLFDEPFRKMAKVN